MGGFPEMRIEDGVDALALVLGDQLDAENAAVAMLDTKRDGVLMIEAREEATHVPSHKQRTAMFLSAMRHYAVGLRDRGVRVEYVRLDDEENGGSFDREFARVVARLKPRRVVCVRPGEWRVLQKIDRWREEVGVEIEVVEDWHFYCTPQEFAAWADGRKRLVMEHFYRSQRKRLGVLMDSDGGPVGGAWNYDSANRRPMKRAPRVKAPCAAEADAITQEVIELVERVFPDAPGGLKGFRWPVSRAHALGTLEDFIEHRLARFGDHQDAMWEGEPFLYHSLLSPALNLKLLNPREVVSAVVAAYERGAAALNSVEGFVRQIIGWREFIRGVYWLEGPGYAQRNGLGAHGALPWMYWTGETDMACMRDSIGQVVEHGYGHHIQRLMVTGNFALLAGVNPKAVSDWYLGMFVDGVDWVTLPNALGMVMHADGGVVGTKPYAASGKYIKRMSNHCAGCRYDVESRSGEGACPFNVLYWDFLLTHEVRFKDNPRMRPVLRHLERMGGGERVAITVSAAGVRKRLGVVV